MLTEQQIRELLSLSDSEQAVFWQGLTPEQASSLLDELEAFRQTAAVQNDTRQSEYERRAAMVRAEVGEIPPPVNPERRQYCRTDLLEFLRQYFPETTGLSNFSDDQKGAILRMQIAILQGGSRVLNLFPRGFGKTTISENAALWAVLYGHRKFIPIIGADEHAAKDNIESIKTELMTNDLLHEDFPEVCRCVAHLENKAQRARSQTYQGEPTYIVWGQDTLVLPSIKDAAGNWTPSSGAIILARGLTGRIRGMAHKRPDGVKQRPDFVIIDDPQTDVSAMSPAQCTKRLDLIRKGVLRLGGHNEQIAAIMNATVIIEDDAVDQLADHQKHPEWEGLRIPMLKRFSDNHETFWLTEYAELRRNYNPEDPHDRRRAIEASNQLYLANRERADAGAVATWPECYSRGEHSAIQHAYNILIDDGEDVFASECQNQPLRQNYGTGFLAAGEINRDRVGTWNRFPSDVVSVGFHIDVQKRLLYWTAVGVSADFRIYPIYGTYPQQKNNSFEYRAVKLSIQQVHKGMSEERSIQAALEVLLQDLTGRQWERQDGVKLPFDVGLIDGGYQVGAVRAAIKANPHSGRLFTMFGRGVKAGDVPMMQRSKAQGEIRSVDAAIPWTMKPDPSAKGFRNVFDDTNAVKTFLHRRLATDSGRGGSVELPKGDHRRYCEHLASSEYATETSGPHGTVLEWKQMPGQPDNHWFDTTCGAIVAVSIGGKVHYSRISGGTQRQQETTRRKVSYL